MDFSRNLSGNSSALFLNRDPEKTKNILSLTVSFVGTSTKMPKWIFTHSSLHFKYVVATSFADPASLNCQYHDQPPAML